ncbi:hypothetical protein AURDEDRAFT_177746 [Auricularia subglabra TFB-10046 SS5]|uniref:Uncharacterized protein n=1 Tax=Auricularia subglabra (strain TFB-10046 / SS5) TaxID=717982 RepID=J0WMW8_AURST|nr:hypothetical protein AURDEDRAFT_177746 [Auricularia subglabra TFB-10046 SS5]
MPRLRYPLTNWRGVEPAPDGPRRVQVHLLNLFNDVFEMKNIEINSSFFSFNDLPDSLQEPEKGKLPHRYDILTARRAPGPLQVWVPLRRNGAPAFIGNVNIVQLRSVPIARRRRRLTSTVALA